MICTSRGGGCCLSTSPRSAGTAWRNASFEASALPEFVAGTQLNRCTRFKRRDVRNDDGARPPQGSPRSARPLVLAPGVILVCPSATQMCATPMIVVRESSQVARQAGFTEYDHVIQALPPNGADHPLDVSSLPGRPGAPRAPAGCPSPSPASQNPPRRSGRDRAADSAARSPTERPPSVVERSIPRSDAR